MPHLAGEVWIEIDTCVASTYVQIIIIIIIIIKTNTIIVTSIQRTSRARYIQSGY
jgi:hypothetical protein